MDTNVVAKKKFPIGGIFALLSALAVFVFWLYDLLKTVFSAVILDASVSDILKNLLSLAGLMSIVQTGLLILSFLVLAVLLLAKVRGPVLLAFPVLQIFSLFLELVVSLVTTFSSPTNFLSIAFLLLSLFVDILLLAGNLLFAVVVVANCKEERKLVALAYVCPVVFGAGYGLGFLIGIASYILNVFNYITNLKYFEDANLRIYLFVNFILSHGAISTFIYFILFTLTLFFACKWIVNPYKKGEEPTSDVPAEVIEEAAAESSTKA